MKNKTLVIVLMVPIFVNVPMILMVINIRWSKLSHFKIIDIFFYIKIDVKLRNYRNTLRSLHL
jgi:hypothetical protein